MKKMKFFLIILIVFLTACKNNLITKEIFIDKAKFNGYLIENNKTGYESYPNILNVYYAINRENAYDIQFLELKSVDYAKKFFLLNVDEIKKELTSKDYVKSNTSNTYEYYHGENDEKYYIVIRSNANILYISAPIDYILEIEEFLTDLDIEF